MRVPFNKDDYKYKANGKKLPQTERFLKYLKEQGPITRAIAFNLIGIAELSARAIEVNNGKIRIGMRKVKVNTVFAPNVDVTEYYLL